jgi:glycosyltransferase involved in cell wall biosynthesis
MDKNLSKFSNSKIKALLFSVSSHAGGTQIFIERFYLLMKNEIELKSIVVNDEIFKRLRDMGAQVSKIKFNKFKILGHLNAFLKLLRIAIHYKPDVIILNGQGESYFTFFLRLLGSKIIIFQHSDLAISEKNFLKHFIYICQIHFFSHAVIALTNTAANQLKKKLSSNKIWVISNWIDIKQSEITFEKTTDTFKLLYVGRIDNKDKRVFDLVEAVADVQDIHLKIVGNGPDFLTLTEKCKYIKNIELAGFQNNVTSFYYSSDLFILPSSYEACPLVILEAMAHGVPCLLSDIPTLKEMGSYGRCAVFFKMGDCDDLRNKILEMKNNPSLLIKNKKEAYRKLEQEHSAETSRNKYLELFDCLINNS